MTDSDPTSPHLTAEESCFFQEIEERFCFLRGKFQLLSPRDWALIDTWWKQGIPLPLVLEAMEDVFAARPLRDEGREQIHSLSYMKSEVQRRWRLRCDITSHRRGPREEEARLRREIRRHLGRVARGLRLASETARDLKRESLAQSLLLAEAELKTIRKEIREDTWDPLRAEKQLESLEAEVIGAASRSLEESEWATLHRKIAGRLEPLRAKVSPSAWQETRDALKSQWIRHHFRIPQISLIGEG